MTTRVPRHARSLGSTNALNVATRMFTCRSEAAPVRARASSHGSLSSREKRALEALDQPDAGPTSRRGVLAGTLTALVAGPQVASTAAATPAAPPKPVLPVPETSAGPAANGATGCPQLQGLAAARDPTVNRGCATPALARQQLRLQGLLPPAQVAQEVEVVRARAALALCCTPLEQYRFLMALKDSQGAAFWALMQQDLEALLPVVYTPTVADACRGWGVLLPRPACLYVSAQDAGNVEAVLANAGSKVHLAVITDGERILGEGDLGCHGAGIPVGKCVVYGAAGINPEWVLPIQVDVGTETDALRQDPLYVGLPQRRVRGDAYWTLMLELVTALQKRYGPSVIVHWEDLGAANGFEMLQRLRARGVVTFNDDIQCTAAVAVAAVSAALRLPGVVPLPQQRFLFFGAGQANIGIARLLVRLLQQAGVPEYAARRAIWMMDSKGLILKTRTDLSPQKADFAQESQALAAGAALPPPGSAHYLEAAVAAVAPTALIGAAAVRDAFTAPVVSALVQAATRQHGPYARPLVFALSNPTSRCEVSFADALAWSGGRAVYASGTAFAPVAAAGVASSSGGEGDGGAGRLLRPAQANNAFIFPGLALGCIVSGALEVNDDVLLAAARAVADMVTPDDLAAECILPSVRRLRDVTAAVAAAVAAAAVDDSLSSVTVDSTKCLALLQAAGAGSSMQPAMDCIRRLQFSA